MYCIVHTTLPAYIQQCDQISYLKLVILNSALYSSVKSFITALSYMYIHVPMGVEGVDNPPQTLDNPASQPISRSEQPTSKIYYYPTTCTTIYRNNFVVFSLAMCGYMWVGNTSLELTPLLVGTCMISTGALCLIFCFKYKIKTIFMYFRFLEHSICFNKKKL